MGNLTIFHAAGNVYLTISISISNIFLYVSIGNGLSGSLGEIHSNSLLNNINLASNKLEGVVPLSWQIHTR
jgi:hypothetical protein